MLPGAREPSRADPRFSRMGAHIGCCAVGLQPASASGWLSWAVRAILALAAVLCVAAIFAVWANRQLLDTGYWTRTNTKLLENRAIQRELSADLTDQPSVTVQLRAEL